MNKEIGSSILTNIGGPVGERIYHLQKKPEKPEAVFSAGWRKIRRSDGGCASVISYMKLVSGSCPSSPHICTTRVLSSTNVKILPLSMPVSISRLTMISPRRSTSGLSRSSWSLTRSFLSHCSVSERCSSLVPNKRTGCLQCAPGEF